MTSANLFEESDILAQDGTLEMVQVGVLVVIFQCRATSRGRKRELDSRKEKLVPTPISMPSQPAPRAASGPAGECITWPARQAYHRVQT